MTLSDLKPGDPAFVINGHRNNLFPVVVLVVDETGVQVRNDAKGDSQWFYSDNGQADAEPDALGVPDAILVTADDWRVSVLSVKREFKDLHRSVIDAVSQFSKNPTSFDADLELSSSVDTWRRFAQKADQQALRADNLAHYIDLAKQ